MILSITLKEKILLVCVDIFFLISIQLSPTYLFNSVVTVKIRQLGEMQGTKVMKTAEVFKVGCILLST